METITMAVTSMAVANTTITTTTMATAISAAHNSIMSIKLTNQPSNYGHLEGSIKQVREGGKLTP